MRKKKRQKQVRILSEKKDQSLTSAAGMTRFEFGTIVAFGLIFCLAVAVELGGTTSEGTVQLTHWTPWRDLGILGTSAILLAPLPLIVWVLWKIERKPESSPYTLLGLLVLASVALQALSMVADPRGFHLIAMIVTSPGATSYFSDAIRIGSLPEFLRHFHQIDVGFHSLTHPPGPIIFYYVFAVLFGPATGAVVGGWAVGAVGSMGVLAIYAFAGLWTDDRRVRVTAAALYALIPALTLFFPEFDQVYPILAMLIMLGWVRSLGAPGLRPALGTAVVLFLATFFAYNLLTIGAFMAWYAIYWLWRTRGEAHYGKSLLRSSTVVLGMVASLHALLWLATGYNPIATLRRALAVQDIFAAELHRAYAPFVLLDVYDFFLGAGMLALPILLFHLNRQMRAWDLRRTDLALTLIGLATVLTIDLSGLLRGETARVWLFLQPLLVIPVAIELARAPWRWKLTIFGLQWWILACLKAKMTFLDA